LIEKLHLIEGTYRKRAAVLNDYASAIPIQISVYTNKLMIWNPGQLPPDWTVEKLLSKHSSQPFNPDIANAFFRSGMIESWGRGIERILAACAATGLSAPKVIEEQTDLWINFHFLPAGDGEVAGERLGETRAAIVKALYRKSAKSSKFRGLCGP
jgi:ATP-dependent DNA helicase RecG